MKCGNIKVTVELKPQASPAGVNDWDINQHWPGVFRRWFTLLTLVGLQKCIPEASFKGRARGWCHTTHTWTHTHARTHTHTHTHTQKSCAVLRSFINVSLGQVIVCRKEIRKWVCRLPLDKHTLLCVFRAKLFTHSLESTCSNLEVFSHQFYTVKIFFV